MFARATLAIVFAAMPAVAQFIAPPWRGEADTEHASWDVFTHAKLSPNSPDKASDLPTADARLICSTSSAFITNSGNIYSFQAAIACQLDDDANFPIRNIFMQIVTLGSGINTETVRIVATNASGSPYLAYPMRRFIIDQEALGGEFGGTGTTYAFQWDFSDAPQNAAYSLLFEAAASSASLDKVSLDTSATYLVVDEPVLPTLSIQCEGHEILLSWPLNSSPVATLEQAPSLDSPEAWQPVEQTPVAAGDTRRVTLPISPTPLFFRLNY